MKLNLLICSSFTSLMLILPATQAHASWFDGLKKTFQPVVNEEPAAQEVNVDNYSDQAAILTTTLVKLAPLMKGKSQTGQLSQDLNLDPSSLGLDMGENGIKVSDGLEVSLGGISLDPIGVKLTVYMDGLRVLKSNDYSTEVLADGSMDMTIGYSMAKQKVIMQMDSADYGPVVYTGGQLDGTAIEFEDVEVSISTKKYLMPWEEQLGVEGTIYVNDTAISIEEMKKIIDLLMKG